MRPPWRLIGGSNDDRTGADDDGADADRGDDPGESADDGRGDSVDDERGEPAAEADANGSTPPVRVGDYTWETYAREFDRGAVVRRGGPGGVLRRLLGGDGDSAVDWEATGFDPSATLGFPPEATRDRVARGKGRGRDLSAAVDEWLRTWPVVKDQYTWDHFRYDYYTDADGGLAAVDDRSVDREDHLGFDPADLEDVFAHAKGTGCGTAETVDRRTVDVDPAVDEDAFFSTPEGHTTLVNRYDLEKAVDTEKKAHLREVERYWVDKPNAFVVVLYSSEENEKKYYVVGPHLNAVESDLKDFLTRKLRTSITYADGVVVDGEADERAGVIADELRSLLHRYDLYGGPTSADASVGERFRAILRGSPPDATQDGGLDGIETRPEPVVVAEDARSLSEYQVAKLRYHLTRDFVGYERIDPIKHDVNVEDISCDGYDSPVFVYHSNYEQLITNVEHGREDLDNFVVKLAQRSGKSISKRQPQVDATLPDGSRAQFTLGEEISAHGTNYTIRQFNDVPFTPVDLLNWRTFSLDEMVYLWLCIENNRSLMFAGGTASGKTTSLNAVSLFIPSNAKIVSIEDTREVELPQRNWVASVTRSSFSAEDDGDIDEFALLESALRQRPEYILMGEVRGEEGRTLFQVMSTGHTTLTTFHADSVGEVLRRFTTDPIDVSKTMFTALDLVSIQRQTRLDGEKVRRNQSITEINHYSPENDEINVTDVYSWQAEDDSFLRVGDSNVLESIRTDNGWSRDRLDAELFERRVVLSYLVANGIDEYAKVAATIQAFINDPDTVLALVARDALADRLEKLRGMESVLIDVDQEKEDLVPRPDPDERTLAVAERVLDAAEESLFEAYREMVPSPLVEALPEPRSGDPVVVDAADGDPAIPDLDDATDATGPETARSGPATDGGVDTRRDGDAEEASTDELLPESERTNDFEPTEDH